MRPDLEHELRAHLAVSMVPVEIRDLLTRHLETVDWSTPEAARLVLAVLGLPTRETVRFALRDAYDADLPLEQQHDEAASAVLRLFTHGPLDVVPEVE